MTLAPDGSSSTARYNDHPMNISAYRPLFIYVLLCQFRELSLDALNAHLLENPCIERTFTSETFHKYIHTLRLFGCKISRIDKGEVFYRLDDHPLKMKCSSRELQALKALLGILSLQPLTNTYRNLARLIKNVCQWGESQELGLQDSEELLPDYPGYKSRLIGQFEQYCMEGQVLEIRYKDPNEAVPQFMLLEPIELVSSKKRVYLIGSDPKTNKKIRCELDQIYSHRQLPSRIRAQVQTTVVTFKLTDRLAMNYRPYPGETISDKGEFLLVKNKTDEVEELLKRLVKYGNNCQVISPDWVRESMHNRIELLLEGFDTPLSNPIHSGASTEQKGEILQKWPYYHDNQQT